MLQKPAFGSLFPRALLLLPTSHGHVNGSGLTYLALPDLEHWKKTVMLHLTTFCLRVPWSPKASTSIEQSVTLPIIFPDLFQQPQLPFCQVTSSITYMLLNKSIALNVFTKHTTIWPQSHLTSFHRVITTLFCNLIFWICNGKECISQSHETLSLVGPLVTVPVLT